MTHLINAFVPLFVAIDPLGMLGVFLALTSELDPPVRRRVVWQATMTALIISIAFLLLGRLIFQLLGITVFDFQIAGGLVLLLLSVNDLIFSNQELRRVATPDVGIVPIGIPLIMGPAALTTILITSQSYGFWTTLVSLLLNLLITWIAFDFADVVMRTMTKGGTKAFAKIMSLFLAAIAVMMIRVGVEGILKHNGLVDN